MSRLKHLIVEIHHRSLWHKQLLELWSDADPEFAPQVESARRALEALSPDS